MILEINLEILKKSDAWEKLNLELEQMVIKLKSAKVAGKLVNNIVTFK